MIRALGADRVHLLTVFVAVVDVNTFAGAARLLGISPPAVTRAIAELERQLGVRLLTRTTRSVRVTSAGARYAEDCRQILARLRDADAAAAGHHQQPQGHLTITAPVLFGARYLSPILAEYLERHPQVSASALLLDRVVNLMEEGVDVALRIGEVPDSTLQAITVGQVRRVLCASPAYLARHPAPRSPADLPAHQIIAVAGSGHAVEWRFAHGDQTVSQRLVPRLTTTTHDAALAMALCGLGVTRLLSYQVRDHLLSGALVELLADHAPQSLPVNLLHREGRYASGRARTFLDLAADRLRGEPGLMG